MLQPDWQIKGFYIKILKELLLGMMSNMSYQMNS